MELRLSQSKIPQHLIQYFKPSGLKPKDLCGMPWAVAFALQADGWWLRSDIIWSKPNPMPESVTDRPTRSHEYVFLLTKSARYFYDQDAIREKSFTKPHSPGWINSPETPSGPMGIRSIERKDAIFAQNGYRNRRSVWTIATQPFPEAHFATFPPGLVRPMILAGTSEYGCCSECGAPWERVSEKKTMIINRSSRRGAMGEFGRIQPSGTMVSPAESKTIGWQPTCKCNAEVNPCIVLDPFGGSGTVAEVAVRNARNFISIDLNPEYCEMAEKRLKPFRNQLKLALK